MNRQPVLLGERLELRPLREGDWAALYAVAADPVLRESGAIVGSSRWQRHDPADGGSVEIGWTLLARAHWGSGLNLEMKRLMLGHAFQWVETVRFRVGEGNARSRRALAKIGARETGESEVVTTASGAARHLVYAIRRAEFEAGPLAG